MSYRFNKTIVNIIYPCYICTKEFGSARQVIDHVYNVHGYYMDTRPVGKNRPTERGYTFERRIINKWDVQHFGCPSCWYHRPTNVEYLTQHVLEEHDPPRIEGFVHPPSDNDDDEEEYELADSNEENEDRLDDNDEGLQKNQVKDDIITTMEKLNSSFKKFFS